MRNPPDVPERFRRRRRRSECSLHAVRLREFLCVTEEQISGTKRRLVAYEELIQRLERGTPDLSLPRSLHRNLQNSLQLLTEQRKRLLRELAGK